ncbi:MULTISPECIES: hypothetical protein [Xanthocytophaga]|uniref:Ppx/GppA phosphatase N-terminal domain-containing protein n=2 Tax=Xanthocytophaga TaxID=3078918 RepID=A0AAE3QK15_9BACT|nr:MULTISPECIES: hypothetical protein [Xanthocytophaga]MDJ1480315.1 hypothetical protein [Xanthocytophaga flavus]MDJ1504673.1 hypothetical protein [Xanthocytophaga agilis]
MAQLTSFGRFTIVAIIIAAIAGGYIALKNKGIIGGGTKTEQVETSSDANPADGTATEKEPESSGSTEATSASSGASSFSYEPPAPTNGKLKGVVEMGASGFNSFIVKADADKNWKLEKAEFGNSLVTENMASQEDIRSGLKKYIGTMLDYGVSPKDIHFVVSSGAAKAEVTQKITKELKSLNYYVNVVTAEEEGTMGLQAVLPPVYEDRAFVVDIGSGNTKISWKENGKIKSLESYGAKYFQNGVDDQKVYDEIVAKAKQVPEGYRKTCFIIGGAPFKLAKEVRNGKERYTVLKAPGDYNPSEAKDKAGVNIYKAIADATECKQFVFDWDANFTIGFLLSNTK